MICISAILCYSVLFLYLPFQNKIAKIFLRYFDNFCYIYIIFIAIFWSHTIQQALYQGVLSGDIYAVSKALWAGVDGNISQQDTVRTPLHYAALTGDKYVRYRLVYNKLYSLNIIHSLLTA